MKIKNIIYSLALVSNLFAAELELDNLLEDFATENDLSNETKAKEVGSAISTVYTRKDLDNLQYQYLKDILATQRYFPYRENRYGDADLISADPLPYGKGGQLVKVFIDDHELSLPYLSSAISIFGNIALDFVDHIEVYEGASSYEYAKEPAILTIKLYSKTPQRDSGSKIGLNVDQYNTHREFFYTASDSSMIKYFIYLSNKKGERESIENDIKQPLDRNIESQHLYSTFEYDKNKFILQYVKSQKSEFITDKDDIENDFLHLAYDRKFLEDDSLELKVSYDRSYNKYDHLQTTPFLTMPNAHPMYNIVNIYGQEHERVDTALNLSLLKTILVKNHTFILGTYMKHNKIDMKKDKTIAALKSTTLPIPDIAIETTLKNKLDEQKYYSAYIQDSYKINNNHTIMGNIKLDKEINSNIDNNDLMHYNISHTYTNNNFTANTLYSKMDLNLVPYFMDRSTKKLQNESFINYGHFSKYKGDGYEISYNGLYTIIKHILTEDEVDYTIINAKDDYKVIMNSVKYNYFYNKSDSVMLEAWINDMKYNTIKNSIKGITIRAINTFDKAVVVNEYKKMNSSEHKGYNGWQYNLSLKYQYSKDLELYVKGENIFDSLDGMYYTNYANKTKGIQNIEQRVSTGMKFIF